MLQLLAPWEITPNQKVTQLQNNSKDISIVMRRFRMVLLTICWNILRLHGTLPWDFRLLQSLQQNQNPLRNGKNKKNWAMWEQPIFYGSKCEKESKEENELIRLVETSKYGWFFLSACQIFRWLPSWVLNSSTSIFFWSHSGDKCWI